MKLTVCKTIFTALLILLIPAVAANSENDSVDPLLNKLLNEGQYTQAVEQAIQQTPEHYLSEIITQSRQLKLSQTPMWQAFVHYKRNFTGRKISMVDGADFFLADQGKTNPQAELEATLASFFSTRHIKPTRHSSQCKFVARYHWLKSKLEFDPTRLIEELCPDYENFIRLLSPESLTVVFPTTHPGSPSSMFGHTLLRVNKKGWTEKTRMLNYSINFAAQVPPETNSLAYTAFGLGGGFKGQYSVLPYYSKLREYAQMENRDIWEYTLNLDAEQTTLIVRHVYELAPSYFDYYFFTENCSYHLLSLLDVIFPEQPLTNEFKTWTIPVDTIRVLAERDLVADVKYYPSSSRVINKKRETLDDSENKLVLAALENKWEPSITKIDALPVERQAIALDLLNDYYRYNKFKSSNRSDGSLSKKEKKILLKRAKIPISSETITVPPPTIRSDHGHKTARAGIGEVFKNQSVYTELSWRPAYHDLLDPSDGYATSSALEFMDIRFQINHETRDAFLDSVTVLDIVSLEPRDVFFNNISWRLRSGWQRGFINNTSNSGLAYLDFGGGLSYRLSKSADATLLYGFAESEIAYGKPLNENHRLAVGYQIGLISEPIRTWRLQAYLQYRAGLLGETSHYYYSNISQSLRVTRNISLQFNAEQLGFSNIDPTYKLSAYYYF